MSAPRAVLLHNAKATHGSRRFTHPDEKIMCAVQRGTVISGQGRREEGGADPADWQHLKPRTDQRRGGAAGCDRPETPRSS